MDASPAPGEPESHRPVRIALLLEEPDVPQYLAAAIDEVRAAGLAEVVLVATPVHRVPRKSPPALAAYRRWDRRHVPAERHPLTPVRTHARWPAAPHVTVDLQVGASGQILNGASRTALWAAALDVLLCVGFTGLGQQALDLARYGGWWARPDPADDAAALLDTLERRDRIGTMALVARGGAAGSGVTIQSGTFAVSPSLSQRVNELVPFWMQSQWIARALETLATAGWPALAARGTADGRPTTAEADRPANGPLVRWFASTAASKLAARTRRRPATSYWSLAMARGARPLVEQIGRPDLSAFALVSAPAGHFYADPFLIEHAGAVWLFFEYYDFAAGRGRLACARPGTGVDLDDAVTILDRPYHLSYPCVFRDGTDLFLVPESKGNGTVDLYRCRRFPDDWEHVRTLFTGRAVDTTVLPSENGYWFFTTRVDARGGGSELWLFSADRVDGEWTPHPANPLSADVRRCRGAGAIVARGGRLFRPAQDGSRAYGWGFSLNAIEVLDRERYLERLVVSIEPTWRPALVGTHSYATLGDLEVVDACTLVDPRLLTTPRDDASRDGRASRVP
jgi:hypothetical protein